MSYKLDRSLWGALVAAMLAAPPVLAVSDDVAVQLLERLNELESEVSSLRGENELLRDKLGGTPTRAEEEELLRKDADKASAEAGDPVDSNPSGNNAATPLTPGVRDVVEDVPEALKENALADIPPLEAVETTTSKPEETAPVAPVPAQRLATPGTGTDSKPAESNTATAPDTNAPATATSNTTAATIPTPPVSPSTTTPDVVLEKDQAQDGAAKVDPRSKDSYYYYGTAEEKAPEKKDAPASTTVAAPSDTVADKPEDTTVPTTASNTSANAANHKAKAEYNQAYQLLVSNPGAAVPLFRTFMSSYPNHELAANAQYWLAEALYAQKDYESASQEFMKVLKQYKDSPKASGAALKLGYSFYELKQWEYARRTLEDTVRFFPDSNAAKLAETRLQRMKTEGH